MSTKIKCANCDHYCIRNSSDLRRSKSGKVFCTVECRAEYQRKLMEKASGLPSWARTIFASAKKRAAKKGVGFTITVSDMAELVALSNGRCALSGIVFDTESQAKKHQRRPYFPSLDRIDSRRGYEPGNVRIVCVAINLAMNSWGEDVLFGIAVGVLSDALPFAMYRGKYTPTLRGKRLGSFDNQADAVRVYLEAKRGCDNRAIDSDLQRCKLTFSGVKNCVNT